MKLACFLKLHFIMELLFFFRLFNILNEVVEALDIVLNNWDIVIHLSLATPSLAAVGAAVLIHMLIYEL